MALTATSAGGGPLALVVGTGPAARTLALTEAEVWVLVEARRLGQPICDRFTEGVRLPELVAARAVLEGPGGQGPGSEPGDGSCMRP